MRSIQELQAAIAARGPVAYLGYQCPLCQGDGTGYDITCADSVATRGTGRIRCSRCDGRGHVLKLATSTPPPWEIGPRMPHLDCKI